MTDMSEEEYYLEILGPPPEPTEINDGWADRDNDARSPLEADLEDIHDVPF